MQILIMYTIDYIVRDVALNLYRYSTAVEGKLTVNGN